MLEAVTRAHCIERPVSMRSSAVAPPIQRRINPA